MTQINHSDRWTTNPGGSFKSDIAVVPSDVTVYKPALQALYVGTTGDVTYVNKNGDTATLVAALGWHYVEVTKVLAATSADDIVGFW